MKNLPRVEEKNNCHCKKSFRTTKQWVNDTESSKNVTAKSFLWHLFKHQIHSLWQGFNATASSVLARHFIPTSNIWIHLFFFSLTTLISHRVFSDQALKCCRLNKTPVCQEHKGEKNETWTKRRKNLFSMNFFLWPLHNVSRRCEIIFYMHAQHTHHIHLGYGAEMITIRSHTSWQAWQMYQFSTWLFFFLQAFF